MKQVLTNVRLPLGTLKTLKHRAVEERRPAAALVREAVEQYLLRPPDQNVVVDQRRWLEGVIGSARTSRSGKGSTDLALNHDHYLYGAPRKRRSRRSAG